MRLLLYTNFCEFSIDYVAHVVKKSKKLFLSFLKKKDTQFSRPASHHARQTQNFLLYSIQMNPLRWWNDGVLQPRAFFLEYCMTHYKIILESWRQHNCLKSAMSNFTFNKNVKNILQRLWQERFKELFLIKSLNLRNQLRLHEIIILIIINSIFFFFFLLILFVLTVALVFFFYLFCGGCWKKEV